MKIVHCPGWYFPESSGGTESYVRALGRAQQAAGAEVAVLAPRDGDEADRYVHDGLRVLRYPVPRQRSRPELSGERSHAGFDRFAAMLREERPEIFHLHSTTPGAGLFHLREARRQGARCVLTAHVPGILCERGTMMRNGVEACDGRVDERQCVPCWLRARALSEPLVAPASLLSASLGGRARALPGRAGSVLSTAARVRATRARLFELSALCSRIVVVCGWLREAMIANGLPAGALLQARQAVSRVLPEAERGPRPPADGDDALRIGFFGRGHPVKGLDLLVRAVCAQPAEARVRLRIFALAGSEEERAHLAVVQAIARGDARIEWHTPLASDLVQDAMRDCDLVAVPSRWLETGPMVALDALAAGIPVLGSDLGGLRELVEPGVSGWLEPADDLSRWSARIASLASGAAPPLHFGPDATPLSTWDELAARMLALYAELP